MPRRHLDVAPWAVIAACVAWTGQFLWFGKDLADMAATRHLIWQGDLWRIPSAIFSHGGFWHLAVNCLGILFIGPFVARTFGGLIFVAAVIFAAFAGLAASLITHPPGVMLVGISGGLVGLLGVILAVEWRLATGFMAFLRQRNTRVVIIVIVVNAVLAVVIESYGEQIFGQAVLLDHAAHTGGLVFGLLGTLALLRKRDSNGMISRNVPRALVAALVLAVLPLAYAAWPQWTESDIPELRNSAGRALLRGDRGRAARLYRQIRDIDPRNPIAAAWLASLESDPTLLRDIREPVGDHERRAVLLAHLELAIDLVVLKPDEALALIKRVRIRSPFGGMWLAFAQQAQREGAHAAATYAFNEAALSLPPSQAWRAAGQALAVQTSRIAEEGISPEERLLRCMEAAGLALSAAGGLAFIEDPEELKQFELAASAIANDLGRYGVAFAALEVPPDGWRDLFARVKKIYQRLADNQEGYPSEAESLYRSADAWWRQIRHGPTESTDLGAVSNRFTAAGRTARKHGKKRVELRVKAWFTRRGLPEPNLADEEGGD